jgi:hypothetical protein
MSRTEFGTLDPGMLKLAEQDFARRLYQRLPAVTVLLGTIPAGGAFPDDFRPLARTCLSCGAKTNAQGEIPCGH